MPVVTSDFSKSFELAQGSQGLTPVVFTRAFATTEIDNTNDQVLLTPVFPANSRLWLLGISSTDMDTNVSATLTLNIGVGDSDGTLDTTLISGSTVGQAGTSDQMDATALPGLDVSGKYLIVDVGTAAATAAAGTLTVTFAYSTGTKVYVDDGT